MYKCFFTTPELYEEIRRKLDVGQGFPNHIAYTCIPPVEELFIDENGKCHICVDIDYVINMFLETAGVIEELSPLSELEET